MKEWKKRVIKPLKKHVAEVNAIEEEFERIAPGYKKENSEAMLKLYNLKDYEKKLSVAKSTIEHAVQSFVTSFEEMLNLPNHYDQEFFIRVIDNETVSSISTCQAQGKEQVNPPTTAFYADGYDGRNAPFYKGPLICINFNGLTLGSIPEESNHYLFWKYSRSKQEDVERNEGNEHSESSYFKDFTSIILDEAMAQVCRSFLLGEMGIGGNYYQREVLEEGYQRLLNKNPKDSWKFIDKKFELSKPSYCGYAKRYWGEAVHYIGYSLGRDFAAHNLTETKFVDMEKSFLLPSLPDEEKIAMLIEGIQK